MDKNILNQEEVDFLLKGETPKKESRSIASDKRFTLAFAQKLSKRFSLRCSVEFLEIEEVNLADLQLVTFSLGGKSFFFCDSELCNALLDLALGAEECSSERGNALTALDMELVAMLFRFVPSCVALSFDIPCSALIPLLQGKRQGLATLHSFLLRCGEIQGRIYLSLGKA